MYFCQENALRMIMETEKRPIESRDAEILFSRTVKAGQRIYYIDVKRNRKDEMYLSITESKKMFSGSAETPQVNFEKHKIFLFREDFAKFRDALADAFNFVDGEQGDTAEEEDDGNSIKLDLEFPNL